MIEYVIVGIGMNVNTPEDGFSEEMGSATLFGVGRRVDRCRLSAAVLDELEVLYHGIKPQTLRVLCRIHGELYHPRTSCPVVTQPGMGREAVGLTEGCELIVKLADGTRQVVFSEMYPSGSYGVSIIDLLQKLIRYSRFHTGIVTLAAVRQN